MPVFPDSRYWKSGTWRDETGYGGIFKGLRSTAGVIRAAIGNWNIGRRRAFRHWKLETGAAREGASQRVLRASFGRWFRQLRQRRNLFIGCGQ